MLFKIKSVSFYINTIGRTSEILANINHNENNIHKIIENLLFKNNFKFYSQIDNIKNINKFYIHIYIYMYIIIFIFIINFFN